LVTISVKRPLSEGRFMKVRSKIYRGIEYIQVNELPQPQQEKLLQTLDRDLFIKILIDEKIVSQCIQYKDYEHWFENMYKPGASLIISAKPGVAVEEMALNKAS
jgi:hypothetical protein